VSHTQVLLATWIVLSAAALPVCADPVRLKGASNRDGITIDSTGFVDNSGIIVTTDPTRTDIAPVGGQTFFVPSAGARLESFEFWARAAADVFAPVRLQAFVSEWSETASSTVGPVLYASNLRSLERADAFQHLSFSPPSLAVRPNTHYVAYLSSPEQAQFGMGHSFCSGAYCAMESGHDYVKGHFLYGVRTTGTGAVNWPGPGDENYLGNLFDATFRASISREAAVTPEPTSISLLGSALLFMAFRWRNCR
jgi:hypothetical protein